MPTPENPQSEPDAVTAMFEAYDQTRKEEGVIPAFDQMRQTLNEMDDKVMPWPSRFDVIDGKITKETSLADRNDPANKGLVDYLDELRTRVADGRAKVAIAQKARLAQRPSRRRNDLWNGGNSRIPKRR
jgi:hypothetical protein